MVSFSFIIHKLFQSYKNNILVLSDEYFLPDGVIKKPFLHLIEIFPDLNADNFLLLSILENLIISDLGLII